MVEEEEEHLPYLGFVVWLKNENLIRLSKNRVSFGARGNPLIGNLHMNVGFSGKERPAANRQTTLEIVDGISNHVSAS